GGVGAGVLQGAFALALAAGASLAPVPAALARSARLAGPTLWVLVALAGSLAGRAAPTARSAIFERSPVLGGPSMWLAP
ncbi:MAG: hypothetical protein OZ921_21920, partial [Sorangiineae bacterium]|nr:hypothetical protein [Sorangiineae bacterium]